MRLNDKRAFTLLYLTVAQWGIGALAFVIDVVTGDHNIAAAIAAVAVLLNFGLMIFYLIHLYSTSGLRVASRVLWLVLIVFVSFLAMPLYWYLHVWDNYSDGAA
jgi:hypothetical protein